MARRNRHLRVVCAFASAIGGTLRAHEEWNNLHITFGAKTAYVYPFDGRTPKVSAQLLNHHETATPQTTVTVMVNGQTMSGAGFTTFPNGGTIVVYPDNYFIASAFTAGIYDGAAGPAPAVGETKDYTFDLKFALAPGAQPAGGTAEQLGYTQTAKVSFTNLGNEPALAGPMQISGAGVIASVSTGSAMPGAASSPVVEIGTPYSPWLPVPVTRSGAGNMQIAFSQALPERDDWHVRISQTGYASKLVAIGRINDPHPLIDLSLAARPVENLDYIQRSAIPAPTGFWRAAVSESEGTFVAFPGQEKYPAESAGSAFARISGAKLYKYKFDGTKVWEHAPGWEAIGGDMSVDGKFVAYALSPTWTALRPATNNTLVLLDGTTGKVLWTKSAAPADVAIGRKLDSLEVALSPDAKWIAVGSVGSGQVTLVDRATGNFAWSVPTAGEPSFGQVRKLRFSADGQFLYSGSGDSYIRKLRVTDGAVLWKTFAGGWPSTNGLDLTPDGAWLVAGTMSLDTTMIRTSDGRLEWQRESQFADAAFSPDGRHVVTGGGQVYRTVDGAVVGLTREAAPARFAPDSRAVLQFGAGSNLYDLTGVSLRFTIAAALAGADLTQSAYVNRDGRYAIALVRDKLNDSSAAIRIFERALTAPVVPPPPEVLPAAPTILRQPLTQSVVAGTSAMLAVEAGGGSTLSFQWRKGGADLPGQTAPTLALNNVSAVDAGNYTCVVTNAGGSVASNAATFAVVTANPADPARLTNVSVRANIGVAPVILGFAVDGGTTPKQLLIRGSGPALAALGVPGTLPDPKLSLYDGGTLLQSNDSWFGNAEVSALASKLGAFPFTAPLSKDAAIATALGRGSFTVQLASGDAGTGLALAEIYDGSLTYSAATPRIINVSARGDAGGGGDALIAGFVIAGQAAKKVLIRGIGPGLAEHGVFNFLADPQVTLYRDDVALANNDDWYEAPNAVAIAAAAAQAGAFFLSPSSKDAALLLTLPPGGYTVQVTSASGTVGNALAEIYEVP